nr:restriction endonuclease subunit S [uncultured Neisseria sp.]
MRRYDSYKDSGVEWLGEVPSHWEVKKMKFLFQDTSIKNKPDETLLSVTQNRGVIPRDWLEERTVMPSGSLETFKFIEKDDFAISLRSFEGGLEICHHDGIISPAYTVLKYNKKLLNNGYYKYLFKCQKFISEMQTSIVGIREGKNISYEELKYSFLPIPQTNEQQKIAQFLDDKTAKIDQAVDLAEKQIALLKEHKQILIQNAVTRGLNPDVPLKDSGVEWIGQVPKHWEVKKLKYLAKFSPSKSEITCNHEESCSFIPMEKLKLNTLVLDEIKQIKNVYSAYTYFRDEDLLIAKVTPCFENKNFAIAKNLVNSIGFGSSEIYVLRTYNNLFNRFLFYRLQEQNFMEIAISKMSGTGGLKRVPSEFINNFQLALPPLCEQQKIADYLDKQTAKIDQAIALKTAHIEKLKEYKSVLINDVVTGKVRVSV